MAPACLSSRSLLGCTPSGEFEAADAKAHRGLSSRGIAVRTLINKGGLSMMKLSFAVAAIAAATVSLSAVGASADVASATAVSCGGKTNAQLVSGDEVTVNVAIDITTFPGYGTVLTGPNATPYYSDVPENAFVANVPQPVTYTLNQTPAGGEIYVYDGSTTAQVTCPAVTAAIPTMSEWAMILLGLMLAGGAALYIQRRRLEA